MDKVQAYAWASKCVRAQVLRNVNTIATLANSAAILKEYFPHFFWVGFYLLKTDHLVLGPFQGPPACIKLTLDKGVCAAAVRERKTILIADVHDFPGHVACDSRSKSEIVVPVYNSNNELWAVLDVDSEQLNDFDDSAKTGLFEIAELSKNI